MPDASTDSTQIILSLGLALALGMLVGLQREWERVRIAGIRTFGLVSLFGALTGILGGIFGGWVIAAAVVAFASLVIMGNLASLRSPDPDVGLTTEVAMLVMFGVGVLASRGQYLPVVVVSGIVMVLLQGKKSLHGMVRRIGEEDLRAIARLVLIGLVILPVLPNEPYGYYGVFNPFSIWLMVVLIVGISLAAYLARKFLGPEAGTVLTGTLGGLISSTATTVSLARASKETPAGAATFAVMALIAAAVVMARVMVEIAVAAPSQAMAMLPPMLAMGFWMGLVAVVAYRLIGNGKGKLVENQPPSEFTSAVVFGLLYALILLAVAMAKNYFGEAGMYVVAAISGLTDMDAITLSTANLAKAGHVETPTAWRVILVGGMTNLIFKGGMVAALGSRQFIKPVLLGFLASLAGGVLIFILWPS